MASESLGADGPIGQVTSPLQNKGNSARARCAHDRKSPSLFPAWPGGGHWIINEAIARLHENYRHRGTKRDRLHATLKRAHGRASKQRKIEPLRFAVTQKRSPREEAITVALTFALQHADVGHFDEESHSLAVGVWDDKAKRISRPFTLEEWARATRFKRPSQRYAGQDRSSSRLDRALRVCGSDCAEFLYRWQSRPLEDGRHKGKTALTFVSLRLFDALGLGEEIRRCIKEERAKRDARAELPQGAARTPGVADLVKQTIGALEPHQRHQVLEVDRPQFGRLQWEIHGEHPEWSADQVSDEAARRLVRSRPPPDRR